MSELRTVEEGIYHMLVIQIDKKYEMEYIKIKPNIKMNPKDFLCEKGMLDNSNKLIDDEYNYLCKYAHAGEMYDMLLNIAGEKNNKKIINEIFSSCISMISCNLINSFCKLLDKEDIKTTETIAAWHMFLTHIELIKNIDIFREYQNNLEYNFDSVNELSMGYMAESLKSDIETSLLFEEVNEDTDNNACKKVLEETEKYKLKKEKLKYIAEFFVENKKQLDNMEKMPKDDILKMLNEKIERKNEISNIKYPNNRK